MTTRRRHESETLWVMAVLAMLIAAGFMVHERTVRDNSTLVPRAPVGPGAKLPATTLDRDERTPALPESGWSGEKPPIAGEPPYPTAYDVTDLGVCLGANGVSAINAAGQVVGQMNTRAGVRASLSRGGLAQSLGTLGGSTSQARDINARGWVVGWSDPGGRDGPRVFLYRDGVMEDLGTLGGGSDAHGGSDAYGINDAGDVVGDATPPDQSHARAFLFRAGRMTDLGTLGGQSSVATDINNRGEIVGEAETSDGRRHAFHFRGGVMSDLGTLGGETSRAKAINDVGQIVGWAYARRGEQRAFLYEHGMMHDLGTLTGGTSVALGINRWGHVVGSSRLPEQDARAFLHRNGKMVDLNTLLPPGSGWLLRAACAINDAGQICGTGLYRGQSRGFLLTPSNRVGPGGSTITADSFGGSERLAGQR